MTAPRPTALVTGGGVGIGRAIAVHLARAGYRTAITYRSHAPDAELLAALTSDGAPPLAVGLDATDPDAVARLADEVGSELGRLDVLVNNVGGMVRRAGLPDLDLELWRTVMAVNVDSMYLATRALLPRLSDGRGRVINVSSLAGENGGGPGALAYATAKAAMIGFTKALAKELGPRGITVNALAPGFIDETPFHATFTSAEARQATLASIPVGRGGVPEDCASAVVWLASEGAGFVTGATIDLNGGAWVR